MTYRSGMLLSLSIPFTENALMRFFALLGLLFALVFGLVALGTLIDVQQDLIAVTGGGLQGLIAEFPTFWVLVLGMVGIVAVVAAFKAMFW